MKGRIIAICIVLIAVAAVLISIRKLPEGTLAKITWLDREPAAASQETETVELSGVGVFCQHPDYPTGCESVSLYILLDYYRVDATVAEIVEALPKGPEPYEKDGARYGADPEKTFVGDPRSSSSYGVYNGPIAETAQRFREGAVAGSGVSLNELKKIVADGDPVIAWTARSYDIAPEVADTWTDPQTGSKIAWLSNEHAVVVYGYDADSIYISDPYDGKKRAIPEEIFGESYARFGRRIVYYED